MLPDPDLAALRFGTGLPVPAAAPLSPEAMLASLAGPDQIAQDFPIPDFETVLGLLRAADSTRKAARRDPENGRKPYEAAVQAAALPARLAAQATVARAVASPDGFRERLVSFWSDHFSTRSRSQFQTYLPFALTEQAVRPHLAGPFADLLSAVTLHPAMLTYLDQTTSYGPGSKKGLSQDRGLNENLARELIELHTLGVDAAYSQTDVRQMAELLTGLAFDHERGFFFDRSRAEPGPEQVLGTDYDGEGTAPILAALRDLALRPETARHLARKLAVHFVSDLPSEALVEAIRLAYAESGGNLLASYQALLTHPDSWAPALQKARQPYDFIIASLRALGVSGQAIAGMEDKQFRRLILNPMKSMGQEFKGPPGPNGWPEEAEAWINPQGLAGRITWAMNVPGRLVDQLPDPVQLARAALGTKASETLLISAARAENIREGVGLVLSSPEFNRR
jgi:uncharacterized protein (DUF1800 family)